MKIIVMNRYDSVPYPNAATRRQQLHSFLDKCLVAASAVALVAALMFIAVLF